MFEQFGCVLVGNPDIGVTLAIQLLQQATNPGTVYLDADEIEIRMLAGLGCKQTTVAETDLQDYRVVIAKNLLKVQWGVLIVQLILR